MAKEKKKELSKNLWSGHEDQCKPVLAAFPEMSSSIPCFTDPAEELWVDLPNTMPWKVPSPQQVWHPLTAPCFDHIQKSYCLAVSVVGPRYPALDRFHTDCYDSKAFCHQQSSWINGVLVEFFLPQWTCLFSFLVSLKSPEEKAGCTGNAFLFVCACHGFFACSINLCMF